MQELLVPAPTAGCRLTVCIPARDEAELIVPTLAALSAQREFDGRPFTAGTFDVIVYANNCRDGTAEVARAVAAQTASPRMYAIEESLPAADAHIGSARKRVLDIAAERYLSAGLPDGIIASIDSDTLAEQHWVAAILHEMRGRDAVAGHVTIGEADQERLLAPVRLLYARELAYRRILAEVEALVDPCPEDPLPRHGSFVGASFAVTAAAYAAAGGLPPLRRLEDVAFCRALRRIDARIRYSPLVRATTSARLAARVAGGFGTFIADLYECAKRGQSFSVENPERTLDELEARAALRRIRSGSQRRGDAAIIEATYRLPSAIWRPLVDRAAPLGTIVESIVERAAAHLPDYPPVRVETAIDILRTAAAERKARQRIAHAPEPQRSLDAG